jgi:hypothetical protein
MKFKNRKDDSMVIEIREQELGSTGRGAECLFWCDGNFCYLDLGDNYMGTYYC